MSVASEVSTVSQESRCPIIASIGLVALYGRVEKTKVSMIS